MVLGGGREKKSLEEKCPFTLCCVSVCGSFKTFKSGNELLHQVSRFHLHFLHTSQFAAALCYKSLPPDCCVGTSRHYPGACYLKKGNLKLHLHTKKQLAFSGVTRLSAK